MRLSDPREGLNEFLSYFYLEFVFSLRIARTIIENIISCACDLQKTSCLGCYQRENVIWFVAEKEVRL